MKDLLKKLYHRMMSHSKWIAFASTLAWLALNSLGRKPSTFLVPSQNTVTVAESRQVDFKQEQEMEQQKSSLKIFDIRGDKTTPFYDYKTQIYLPEIDDDYDVLRITRRFMKYNEGIIHKMLHPILKEEDLLREPVTFAKRHIKKQLPSSMYQSLLTQLQVQGESISEPGVLVYANLPDMPGRMN